MSLFISLAYISIALDATGLLRFLAFRVVQKGGSSGRRLYLYLYLFFFAAGLIVGNASLLPILHQSLTITSGPGNPLRDCLPRLLHSNGRVNPLFLFLK